MKTLKLEDGATYSYGPNGERVCTGSSMGRRNVLPANKQAKGKLQMVKLGWVDGDYDQGGAYWGNSRDGSAIYCAWGDLEGEEFTTRLFVRANSRTEAKELVRQLCPAVTFYR